MNNFEGSFLILLSLSPLVAFSCHLVLERLVRPSRPEFSPLHLAVIAVSGGGVFTLAISWQIFISRLETGSSSAFVFVILVYGCLALTYFQCFAMTETARRIRILQELVLRGPCRYEELKSRYGPSDMFSVRLKRLQEWGQIRHEGNHLLLKSRLLYGIALILHAWAVVLGFKSWEDE